MKLDSTYIFRGSRNAFNTKKNYLVSQHRGRRLELNCLPVISPAEGRFYSYLFEIPNSLELPILIEIPEYCELIMNFRFNIVT